MTVEPPTGWDEADRRTYTPADSDRPKEYVTFVHESGDLRVRIAPASIDGDEYPGYAATVTTYPGLEFSESARIGRAYRYERCSEIAERFMELFSASYEGPGDFEDALEYAAKRVRAPEVIDALFEVDR